MKSPIRTLAPFSHVAIIGVGVIGGSLGLAVKKRFRSVTIVGFDRRDVLKKALRKGAIDRAATSLRTAVDKADLVLLAMPVSEILKSLPRVAKYSLPDALVSDVGSIKENIVRRARGLFPRGNFVGGHPMAGVELSGVEAAHQLLFENAVYVLTPMQGKATPAVRRLASFLEELGAHVVLLDSKTHDEVASVVSHLPQLTAVALTNVAGARHVSGRRHLRLAAGGFRDLTRIASSKPEIWADILTQNRDQVDASLRLMIRELSSVPQASCAQQGVSSRRRIQLCTSDSKQYSENDERFSSPARRTVRVCAGSAGDDCKDDFVVGESQNQHQRHRVDESSRRPWWNLSPGVRVEGDVSARKGRAQPVWF